MHSDPRRRFLFAFTIENVNMRLWYCDRSQTVVSESFNFITASLPSHPIARVSPFLQDHRPFVQFMLSIVYARQPELGLDPSMTLIDEGQQLDIAVHSEDGGTRLYRTLGLLAEREPDALYGKGTRVWKAVQIVDGRETGDHIALKDAWVAAEQPLEGTVFSQLFNACHSTDPSQQINNSLVTVEAHGDVLMGGVLDVTPNISRTGGRFRKSFETRADLLEFIERNRNLYPAASWPSSSRLHTPCLVHYRIVYKEVCKPLSEETSLVVIFRALAQIALSKSRMISFSSAAHHLQL